MPDMSIAQGPGYIGNAGTPGSCTTTTNAVANTKGAYSNGAPVAPFDADGLVVMLTANVTGTFLMDIAIGGAGSEVVVCPNVFWSGIKGQTKYIHLPIQIPAGATVSICGQSATGGQQWYAWFVFLRRGLWGVPSGGQIISVGEVTASSRGTQVDPGASAGTYGAWAQLTASTSADITALYPNMGHALAVSSQAAQGYFDIGVGAAASEIPIIENFPYGQDGANNVGSGGPGFWLPVNIPAGSRIAVRARINVNTNPGRQFYMQMNCLTA